MAKRRTKQTDRSGNLNSLNDNAQYGRLCDIIERNIKTLHMLQRDTALHRSLQERIADGITEWSGRMEFLYLHAGWFAIWILLNTGQFGIRPFDPYPYGLLTMIVSLEAIFLSTFVLISQNRITAQGERQAELLLQVALLTEHEVTRALKMLDAIQDQMGIENNSDPELSQLEQETLPEEVLKEIERVKSTK